MSELTQMLIRHEDIKLKPYTDSVGKMTIGVGRNLDDNGISEEEAMLMLNHDIANTTVELFAAYPWIQDFNVPRQDALIDMAFNLGIPRFSKFKKMLAALARQEWRTAHDEMLDSKWAVQVGSRGLELAQIILTGQYA